MLFQELLNHLAPLSNIGFRLPSGAEVPSHFHVTEVAKVQKDFVDCGGKVRSESKIYLQLWSANDYDHRLHPEKFIQILLKSKETFDLQDWPVEVEFQGTQAIERYGLSIKDGVFHLVPTQTDCLALSSCGFGALPLANIKCC